MAMDFLGLEWFVVYEVRSFRCFTTVYCSSFFGATTVYAVVYLLFNLCAKYIIAINDVLLRTFFVPSLDFLMGLAQLLG